MMEGIKHVYSITCKLYPLIAVCAVSDGMNQISPQGLGAGNSLVCRLMRGRWNVVLLELMSANLSDSTSNSVIVSRTPRYYSDWSAWLPTAWHHSAYPWALNEFMAINQKIYGKYLEIFVTLILLNPCDLSQMYWLRNESSVILQRIFALWVTFHSLVEIHALSNKTLNNSVFISYFKIFEIWFYIVKKSGNCKFMAA